LVEFKGDDRPAIEIYGSVFFELLDVGGSSSDKANADHRGFQACLMSILASTISI